MCDSYNICPFLQRMGSDLKGFFQVPMSKDNPIYVEFYADSGWLGTSNSAVGRLPVSRKMLFTSHPPSVGGASPSRGGGFARLGLCGPAMGH
jgi:hypothetical protein